MFAGLKSAWNRTYLCIMFSLGSLSLRLQPLPFPSASYTNLLSSGHPRIGGVDLCTADLVNARSLIEQNPKALKLIETFHQDSPLSVQLFGGKGEMRDTSILLQEHGVDSIDVNMGCPVPKVTKTGGGASMMNELPKTRTDSYHGRSGGYSSPPDETRLGRSKSHCTGRPGSRRRRRFRNLRPWTHRSQGFEGVVNLEGIGKVVEGVQYR